jgi:hypothetical protein
VCVTAGRSASCVASTYYLTLHKLRIRAHLDSGGGPASYQRGAVHGVDRGVFVLPAASRPDTPSNAPAPLPVCFFPRICLMDVTRSPDAPRRWRQRPCLSSFWDAVLLCRWSKTEISSEDPVPAARCSVCVHLKAQGTTCHRYLFGVSFRPGVQGLCLFELSISDSPLASVAPPGTIQD